MLIFRPRFRRTKTSFPLHPRAARHRMQPTDPTKSRQEESPDASPQLKSARRACRRHIYHGGLISVVLPFAFRETLDEGNGLRPQRQSHDGGNEENRRPGLWRLLLSQPNLCFHTGTFPARDARGEPAYWAVGWVPRLAGLRGHRAVHLGAVHKAKHEALRYQYRLPAGVLSRHGCNPHRLDLTERECHLPAQGAGSAAEIHPNGSALGRRTRWPPPN